VIVTSGGRDLAWPLEKVVDAMRSAADGGRVDLVLHGGARGADALVDQAARRLGWRLRVMVAEWSRYGQAAGPIRNASMLGAAAARAAELGEEAQVLLLAFPGGRGTENAQLEARKLRRLGSHPIRVQQVW
jgi:hypothetical protein